jgi:hypothetical protein
LHGTRNVATAVAQLPELFDALDDFRLDLWWCCFPAAREAPFFELAVERLCSVLVLVNASCGHIAN